jgi:hypothetical protein
VSQKYLSDNGRNPLLALASSCSNDSARLGFVGGSHSRSGAGGRTVRRGVQAAIADAQNVVDSNGGLQGYIARPDSY